MNRVIACLTLLVSSLGAQAALLGRAPLTPGGTDYQAYYDTALNITWLADANYAATSGFDGDGRMDWSRANSWINSLNASVHLGSNNWRLPNANPVDGFYWDLNFSFDGSTDVGQNISAPGSAFPGSNGSEMAHLYYNTLGNTGDFPPTAPPPYVGQCSGLAYPYCLTKTGPFGHMISDYYWSRTLSPNSSDQAAIFGFYNSNQTFGSTQLEHYAWAVLDGDIAVVPVPAVGWLLGPALGVLTVLRRRASA